MLKREGEGGQSKRWYLKYKIFKLWNLVGSLVRGWFESISKVVNIKSEGYKSMEIGKGVSLNHDFKRKVHQILVVL